jgi:hypothetical protein
VTTTDWGYGRWMEFLWMPKHYYHNHRDHHRLEIWEANGILLDAWALLPQPPWPPPIGDMRDKWNSFGCLRITTTTTVTTTDWRYERRMEFFWMPEHYYHNHHDHHRLEIWEVNRIPLDARALLPQPPWPPPIGDMRGERNTFGCLSITTTTTVTTTDWRYERWMEFLSMPEHYYHNHRDHHL